MAKYSIIDIENIPVTVLMRTCINALSDRV